MSSLQQYFQQYAANIVGNNISFNTPYGTQQLLYADWIASGRLYAPIEETMLHKFGPYVANTHTETNITGTYMTAAYHHAKQIIKQHVHANEDDVLIAYGSGMTGVINKFQRILGFRMPELAMDKLQIAEVDKPIVFVTHMEHHSNHTSWIETICDVVKIDANADGLVCLDNLAALLEKYKNRNVKIAAITGCSNVTGIETPYHTIAAMMHKAGGLCFVDFACSAPYISINMHPANEAEKLDAIYFSVHKFLGGPGTPGILIFNRDLYKNNVPDNPGGGTVKWTNPWNEVEYIDSIEEREDGGTPPFLQTIKAALCVQLKEQIGVQNILNREHELLQIVFEKMNAMPNVHILAPSITNRLGVISFYIDGLHYNLGVKLLNDKFGIQVRGGCSCAGTYGHYLFNIGQHKSKSITDEIHQGVLCNKPGWIRLSVHPTLTNEQLLFIMNAIQDIANNHKTYEQDYNYNINTNEFAHKQESNTNYSAFLEDSFFATTEKSALTYV
jgi:selenocysteine lyase/cysteine desulfurase